MKSIEVVAAVFYFRDKFLCFQRGPSVLDYISKKYEFPGGKIEPGESNVAALKREIKEELDYEQKDFEFFLSVEHQYPDFFITMHTYLCPVSTYITPTLNEHIDAKWLSRENLKTLDWAAADLPIVDSIISNAAP